MTTLKPRSSITFDEDVFQAIQDYRFEHRCKSMSQAVVELVRGGLDYHAKKERQKRRRKERTLLAKSLQ